MIKKEPASFRARFLIIMLWTTNFQTLCLANLPSWYKSKCSAQSWRAGHVPFNLAITKVKLRDIIPRMIVFLFQTRIMRQLVTVLWIARVHDKILIDLSHLFILGVGFSNTHSYLAKISKNISSHCKGLQQCKLKIGIFTIFPYPNANLNPNPWTRIQIVTFNHTFT